MSQPRFALLALALPLALSACDAPWDDAAVASTAPAAPAYLATAVGRIDSAGEARQLVASVDGVIDRVLVGRGDRVRAGQALAVIDCGDRRARGRAGIARASEAAASAQTIALGSRAEDIVAARRRVDGARAARDDAADRLVQAEALAPRGFVSQRELAARRNAMLGSEADLAAAIAAADRMVSGPLPSERASAAAAASAARADAAAARALADQCTLASPIDGDVLQILRREGEFSAASQGAPILVVGDLSGRIVRAEVSERHAAALRPGQRADIWIEGESERWQGRVVELASVMGRRSARSLDPTDRYDRDVREALIAFDGPAPPAIVGLRVMVGIRP
jgi:multidrug resistance efflux pump